MRYFMIGTNGKTVLVRSNFLQLLPKRLFLKIKIRDKRHL